MYYPSVKKKKKRNGNFASYATRYDAVSRLFFPDGYFDPQTKQKKKKRIKFIP
jgi:hypothetical protein